MAGWGFWPIQIHWVSLGGPQDSYWHEHYFHAMIYRSNRCTECIMELYVHWLDNYQTYNCCQQLQIRLPLDTSHYTILYRSLVGIMTADSTCLNTFTTEIWHILLTSVKVRLILSHIKYKKSNMTEISNMQYFFRCQLDGVLLFCKLVHFTSWQMNVTVAS